MANTTPASRYSTRPSSRWTRARCARFTTSQRPQLEERRAPLCCGLPRLATCYDHPPTPEPRSLHRAVRAVVPRLTRIAALRKAAATRLSTQPGHPPCSTVAPQLQADPGYRPPEPEPPAPQRRRGGRPRYGCTRDFRRTDAPPAGHLRTTAPTSRAAAVDTREPCCSGADAEYWRSLPTCRARGK